MKKNNGFLIFILVIVALVVLGLFSGQSRFMSTLDGDTVQRSFSKDTYVPGEIIEVTYSPIPSGSYGIKEQIPAGWFVIDSAGGNVVDGTLRIFGSTPLTVKLQTPSSGDYTFYGQFFTGGDESWFNFASKTISECSPVCNWAIVGACADSTSDGCGGTCTRVVDSNTVADVDCNGCVSDIEFPLAINQWISQTGVSDIEFPNIVNQWLNQEGC